MKIKEINEYKQALKKLEKQDNDFYICNNESNNFILIKNNKFNDERIKLDQVKITYLKLDENNKIINAEGKIYISTRALNISKYDFFYYNGLINCNLDFIINISERMEAKELIKTICEQAIIKIEDKNIKKPKISFGWLFLISFLILLDLIVICSQVKH